MKAPLRALILSFLIWSSICQVSAQWVQTTFPTEYFTTAFGVSGSTIFVGTRGQGIFRSTDDGTHWEAANDGLGTDTTVSALGVHGSTIYAGTSSPRGVLYVSSNAGTSWQAVDTSLAGGFIRSFAFEDSGGYAGTWGDSAGIIFPTILSSSDRKQWTGMSFPRKLIPISSQLAHNSTVLAGLWIPFGADTGSSLLRSSCLRVSPHLRVPSPVLHHGVCAAKSRSLGIQED